MYKNKEKQRQAVREAVQRYRAKNKGSAITGQEQGSESAPGLSVRPELEQRADVIPPDVIPKRNTHVIPKRNTLVIPKPALSVKAQSYNPAMVGYVPPET